MVSSFINWNKMKQNNLNILSTYWHCFKYVCSNIHCFRSVYHLLLYFSVSGHMPLDIYPPDIDIHPPALYPPLGQWPPPPPPPPTFPPQWKQHLHYSLTQKCPNQSVFRVYHSEKVFHPKNRAISKWSVQDAAPGNLLTSGLKLGI